MSTSPKQALLKEYALVAQALAAPARLMLLEQLAQTEAAVEALARKTGLTVANASQHLQQLRRAGLVTSRRAGKAVIYRLQDARSIALMGLLSEVAEANLAQVTDILDGLSGDAPAPEPITRADLAERLAQGAVTLLDIRPEDEFAAGHIPGARNTTLADLAGSCPRSTQRPRSSPIAVAPIASTPIRLSPASVTKASTRAAWWAACPNGARTGVSCSRPDRISAAMTKTGPAR